MSIHKPDTLCTKVYDQSKYYFNKSLCSRFLVYVTGVVALFANDKYTIAPAIAMILVVLSEYFQYRSDTFKGIAESLRRKLDFWHSFGWSIPTKELSNIILEIPENIEKEVIAAPEENYFISDKEVGAIKSLENLEESAWWSKHLTKCILNIYLGAIGIITAIILIAFYVSFNVSPAEHYLPKISKIMTSSIMVLFSIGIVRTSIGYARFHKKCDQIEMIIPDKIKSNVGVPECIKIWSEYHVARASSPLIPSIIWKLNKKRLNSLRAATLAKD